MSIAGLSLFEVSVPHDAHCIVCGKVLELSERVASYYSGLVPGEFKCAGCMEKKNE